MLEYVVKLILENVRKTYISNYNGKIQMGNMSDTQELEIKLSFKERKTKLSLNQDHFTIQLQYIRSSEVNMPYIKLKNNGELKIERGYIWDGATNWITTCKMSVPTIVHDSLYATIKFLRNTRKIDANEVARLRNLADQEFLHLMQAYNINRVSSYVRYNGVRFFGWLFL